MPQLVKNLPANAGDIRDSDSIPESRISSGEGNDNPLQYSYPENPMDRGAWQATVHRVTKSRTQLKQLSTQPYLSCAQLLFLSFSFKYLCKYEMNFSHVSKNS